MLNTKDLEVLLNIPKSKKKKEAVLTFEPASGIKKTAGYRSLLLNTKYKVIRLVYQLY